MVIFFCPFRLEIETGAARRVARVIFQKKSKIATNLLQLQSTFSTTFKLQFFPHFLQKIKWPIKNKLKRDLRKPPYSLEIDDLNRGIFC